MAHNDAKTPQVTLSAEAEAFVPGKYVVGKDGPPPNGLPSYIMNCYPFVTQHDNKPRAPMTWQGRPRGPNIVGPRPPLSQQVPYTYSSSRPPGVPNQRMRAPVYRSRPVGNVSNIYPQSFIPPPSSSANPHPHYSSHNVNYNTPSPMGQYSPHAHPNSPLNFISPPPTHKQPVWSTGTTSPISPYSDFNAPPYNQAFFTSSQGFYPSSEHGSFSGSDRASVEPQHPIKKKHMESNMVSIGIQNESGVLHNYSPKKSRPKTKTIMLMDAAVQTDFSDEIASLTLVERPNSLYRSRRVRPRRKSAAHAAQYDLNSTTDSEEVDSDSGYSSPLHRRNQVSNGTTTSLTYTPSDPLGYTSISDPHGCSFQGIVGTPIPHVPIVNTMPVEANLYNSNAPYQAHDKMYGEIKTYASVSSARYSKQAAVSVPKGVPHGYKNLPGGVPPQDDPPHSPTRGSNLGKSGSNPGSNSSINKLQSQSQSAHEPDENATPGKKKRRRSRRRKKRNQGDGDVGALSDEPLNLQRTQSSGNVSRTSTETHDTDFLHFEDEEEFPDLGSSVVGGRGKLTEGQSTISYSEVLKAQKSVESSHEDSHSVISYYASQPESVASEKIGKESKTERKRRKRREMANKAAEVELAEITFEQEMLKEMGLKKSQKQPENSGKKSKQPIALNIAAMIDALEKQQQEQGKEKEPETTKPNQPIKSSSDLKTPHNMLDSSAPMVKRGKERETPKAKKPSPLKKVILKEREERKKARNIDDDPVASGSEMKEDDTIEDDNDMASNEIDDDAIANSTVSSSDGGFTSNLIMSDDFSQDAGSSKASSMDIDNTSMSAELSPVSQTSPISMSPLSPGGTPASSGVNSPITGATKDLNPALLKIHSRRFREYCNQVLDKDIDACCTILLQDLVRFQDRLYHKDPVKAKSKRRIVLGLREVTKHLKLRKIKLVIISPNLERIQSKGGLDDALNNIIALCAEQDIPFLFALGRRALGRACAKLVPVSVVGVFNYEGSEENFHNLMALTERARQAYKDMVGLMEKEIAESPVTQKLSGNYPHLFAHMGHSRTPSACSAISFTSSILSEPISENYPQSEPETDSRGYEIKNNKIPNTIDQIMNGGADLDKDGHARILSPDNDSVSGSTSPARLPDNLHDIDEGHEADTEDMNDMGSPNGAEKTNKKSDSTKDYLMKFVDSTSSGEVDSVKELPHIDSIHSMDLNTEILSQHSSKTLELNAADVMSTHSSKTLEAGGSPLTAEQCAAEKFKTSEVIEETEEGENSSEHKSRTLNNARIESWVAETQTCMENLEVVDESDLDVGGVSSGCDVDHVSDLDSKYD
ncbi:unnamed protein product [Owenia fusiformis]|uniref:Uncharacterized protein n=1 Tax=Owenia fusiformis TaxID=6347 RepID=A0A8J1YAF1_OWEFU|nr:unnamed protein product [Owenia fusiformis]